MASVNRPAQSHDDLDSFTTDFLSSVTFDDLETKYKTGCDIRVAYFLAKGFKPSSRDWIGLCKSDWGDPQQYLAFEWAPKDPQDILFSDRRTVLFLAKDIQVEKEPEDQAYRFLYITGNDDVAGMSQKFLLTKETEESFTDGDASFVCVERPLADADSPTTEDSKHSKQEEVKDVDQVHIAGSAGPSTCVSAEVIAEEMKKNKKIYDHDTLLTDFETTEAGGATCVKFPGLVDLSSPVVQHYTTTNERSVVPVANTERSLVAYRDKCMPIYTLAASRQVPNQPVSITSPVHHLPPSPLATPAPLLSLETILDGCKVNCKDCGKQMTKLKAVKKRCDRFRGEIDDLKKKLDHADDTLTLKSIILEELSKQVKNLVHENSELASTNERLATSQHNFRNLTSENRRLLRKSGKATYDLEQLRKQSLALQRRNSALDRMVELKEKESETLRTKNKSLEEDLEELRSQHAELEKHVDDVMYTLSLQGYTKLVDTNGKEIDLTRKKGSVLELDGWTVALGKKTERQLATISTLQQMISMTTDERDELKEKQTKAEKELKALEASREMERERSKLLQERLDLLTKQFTGLLADRSSLATMLNAQKAETLRLEQQTEEKKDELNMQMQNFRRAAQTEKTLQSQGHSSGKCGLKSHSNYSSRDTTEPIAKTTVPKRIPTQSLSFKASPCLSGMPSRGTRPNSTWGPESGTTVSGSAVTPSVKFTMLKAKEGKPAQAAAAAVTIAVSSAEHKTDMQKCFRDSLKSHSAALRRLRCATPYYSVYGTEEDSENAGSVPATSAGAPQQLQLPQDPGCSRGTLRSSDELTESESEKVSHYSLTEFCQRAWSSAASSLGSMYEACVNGDIKRLLDSEDGSRNGKDVLDKTLGKVKKPRKFHFKGVNPTNMQLTSGSPEYTPRVYGGRPRKRPLAVTRDSSCPKCNRPFPPGFRLERIRRNTRGRKLVR